MNYSQLNDLTVKDSFALTMKEEFFDCLHIAEYFTSRRGSQREDSLHCRIDWLIRV